jgi:hypothetical protein
MRIEGPEYFLYGAILFAVILALTRKIASGKMKLHLRALAFTLTLTPVIIAGHGEAIVAPILGILLKAKFNAVMAILVAVSCIFWWVMALGCLHLLARSKKSRMG